MIKDNEYLEKSVINLTIENAKLKIELEKANSDQQRNWKWYLEEKENTESLQAQLDKINNVEVDSELVEAK